MSAAVATAWATMVDAVVTAMFWICAVFLAVICLAFTFAVLFGLFFSLFWALGRVGNWLIQPFKGDTP